MNACGRYILESLCVYVCMKRRSIEIGIEWDWMQGVWTG